MAKRFNFDWSVQDGAVQATQDGAPVPGLAILVSSSTGLIGNVVKRAEGIEFTTLLNGEIKPGRLLSIDSFDVKGFFKTRKVTFQGDTHDGPWFANVEAAPL